MHPFIAFHIPLQIQNAYEEPLDSSELSSRPSLAFSVHSERGDSLVRTSGL